VDLPQAALSGAQAALAGKVREVTALLAATPAQEGAVEQLRGYTALLADTLGALRMVHEAAAAGSGRPE
jgi:hypothetical protein